MAAILLNPCLSCRKKTSYKDWNRANQMVKFVRNFSSKIKMEIYLCIKCLFVQPFCSFALWVGTYQPIFYFSERNILNLTKPTQTRVGRVLVRRLRSTFLALYRFNPEWSEIISLPNEVSYWWAKSESSLNSLICFTPWVISLAKNKGLENFYFCQLIWLIGNL